MEYSFQALNENYWEEIQKMIYIIHPKEHNFRERPYPCEFSGCECVLEIGMNQIIILMYIKNILVLLL